VREVVLDERYEMEKPEEHGGVAAAASEMVQQNDTKVEWNLEWVKAPAVWKKGFTGKGKVVGLVDTGVNFRHPSLSHRYRGMLPNGTFQHDFNWFDPNNRLQEPQDTQDHGSHCTGTVLGATADGKYITGAAYNAKWMHCHFGGTFQAITKCFQFLLAPHNRQGQNPNPMLRPHVTSHSYGGGAPGRSQLEDVVKAVVDAGVHVVVAAHNYARCRTVTDPGVLPFVLTVGALGKQTNLIAGFSSRGPNNQFYNSSLKPEISTPGSDVVSASGSGTGYSSKSGTSMATPLVAGVIALMWEAVPALDRQIAKTNQILYETALHQTSSECESRQPTPNNVYGHGTVNAEKAIQRAIELYGTK
jgi:subtilisin family serine protease